MKEKELTPMQKQFLALKEQHPDALLLFRCGDFYETYGRDAKIAAKVLGITLSKRHNTQPTEELDYLAGFPHHALDTYLPKLVRNSDMNAHHHLGYSRVAICDQLEDPKLTRKLVKRGITEIIGHKSE